MNEFKPDNLIDLYPPVDISSGVDLILILFLSGLVFLFALFLVIYSIKRRKQSKHLVIMSPREEAIRSLKSLECSRNDKESSEQFATALIDILRKFLSRSYTMNVWDMTGDEMLHWMSNQTAFISFYEILKRIISTCDQVKFADQCLDAEEQNRYRDDMIKIIQATAVQGGSYDL